MTIAIVHWALAYLAGYAATETDGAWIGIVAATAVICITIAWVAVESGGFDWHLGSREAAA